jgi:hypothetical protein
MMTPDHAQALGKQSGVARRSQELNLRSRICRSPDRSDALVMTGARIQRTAQVGTFVPTYGGGVLLNFSDRRGCSCYGCRNGTGVCASDPPV